MGALVGLGIEGEPAWRPAPSPAPKQRRTTASRFNDAETWDVLADIPEDRAAALLLIEHHWAVPLRDAIARAGGFRLGDGFISPFDLIAIGLLDSDEDKESSRPRYRGVVARIPAGGPAYRPAYGAARVPAPP
jgi:hypothetical protein